MTMCKHCKMIDRTNEFLIKHGDMPSYYIIKENDEYETLTEKLHNELQSLFERVHEEIIQTLIEEGKLPSGSLQRKSFLEAFYSELFGEEFGEIIANYSVESAERGFKYIADQLRSFDIDVAIDNIPDRTRKLLHERNYKFSQDTFERIKGDVRNSLEVSQEQGLGINEAADALKDEFNSIEEYRLKRIARTEINTAQGEGRYLSLGENGAEYIKWITAKDDRVRGLDPKDKANHVALHGCVVRYGEAFPNGLRYPGDRSGPLEEWINCRCKLGVYIPEVGEVNIITPFYVA